MGSENKLKNKLKNNAKSKSWKMTLKSDEDSASFIPLESPAKIVNTGRKGKKVWPKKSRALKKSRLIVRNLNYKVTEESVRKHFESFGEVTDVVLLRKPNNQLVGCGFIEFSRTQSAAKAIAHASGQQFMGRPIVVDWAVPKDQYLKKTESGHSSDLVQVKEEDDDSPSIIDDSGDEKVSSNVNNISSYGDNDDYDNKADVKYEDDDNNDNEDDEDDEDDYGNGDGEENSGAKKRKRFSDSEDWDQGKKPKFESNDVTEGRTVFLRNLPFSINNDKLSEFAEQLGPVVYAVVCMDPKSDHSRGTGFIKFKNAETANQCVALSQRKELVLDNRTIDVSPAISRDDAKKSVTKEKVKKDNRNLYLLKEGLVTANSPASEGVSTTDMEKRIFLERWKTKTLRDLTRFVSRVRLVIHNLPPSYEDEQLRLLFMEHGGFKPRITEARIMRDLKNVDAKGVGRSKEYGFVTFTNHENALEALRSINNNPTIFGPLKRPIVSFSTEDKRKLNLKEQRQQRSLMKNPTWKHYKKEDGKEVNTNNRKKNDKKGFGKESGAANRQSRKKKNSAKPLGPPAAKETRSFMGAVSKRGEGGTIPLRKLRDQSQIVRQSAKEKKKQARQKRKPERTRQPRQAKKQRESKDEFSALVNRYKASISGASVVRSKWYE